MWWSGDKIVSCPALVVCHVWSGDRYGGVGAWYEANRTDLRGRHVGRRRESGPLVDRKRVSMKTVFTI